MSENRSTEEITKIMGFAKLDVNDMNNCVHSIYMDKELNNEKYKLIEVDSSVLEAVEVGKSVVIRGDKSESAVLCTESKTFELKEAETSNSLLLLPESYLTQGQNHAQHFHNHYSYIPAIHHMYYELRETKPRLRKMRLLLEENPYSGPECEEDDAHQGVKYTLENLLNEVQASEEEIKEHLDDIGACCIDGYWRVFEFDYKAKVLEFFLQIMEEDGSCDTVSMAKCISLLSEIIPKDIIVHFLQFFSVASTEEESDIMKLDEDKVCKFFAEMILRPVEKFSLSEFFQVWQQSVPNGFTTCPQQLEGLALQDRDSQPEIVRFLPVHDLPDDINERFDYLFTTKEKWTLDEITPYVKDLCSEKQTVSALLMRYARPSTQNGVKVYNSKRPLN